MRPADTTRTPADNTLRCSSPVVKSTYSDPRLTLYLPQPNPSLYGLRKPTCQGEEAPKSLRVALVQGTVSFTDQTLSYLQPHKIEPVFVGTPETILQKLDHSLEEWETVVFPIWKHWQRSLDFAREVRRIRERHGAPPYPRVLILSFVEQLPVTAKLFRQTSGTKYSVFTSKDDLVLTLWAMHNEMADARRACRLHLRFVHSGNPSGVGCIPGEQIVGAYGSFLAGQEMEIRESKSVLRFINLLAASRWRFRNAMELIDLMSRHPLYRRKNDTTEALSVGSVKTYALRAEDALFALWHRLGNEGKPPNVLTRESRGAKEIAYRLSCSAEFEHI